MSSSASQDYWHWWILDIHGKFAVICCWPPQYKVLNESDWRTRGITETGREGHRRVTSISHTLELLRKTIHTIHTKICLVKPIINWTSPSLYLFCLFLTLNYKGFKLWVKTTFIFCSVKVILDRTEIHIQKC